MSFHKAKGFTFGEIQFVSFFLNRWCFGHEV
jgi:hypothetical protein